MKATKISLQVYISDKIPINLYQSSITVLFSWVMSVYQFAMAACEMVSTKVCDFTSQ
jgi:hypothetical protein